MLNINKGIQFAPAYKMEVNGIDQTGLVRQRLIDITVDYSAGGESDSLDINLDDSVNTKRLNVPLDKNDQIKVWMGYETNLQNMGTFVVNSVTLSGGANAVDTYSVNAKAIDTAGNIFDRKCKTWAAEQSGAEIPLSSIVNKIASEHSLQCIIDPTLAIVMTKSEVQWRESDISFLRKLAEKYSAVVKFYDKKLLFISKNSKSATGIPIPPILLNPQDITDWRVTFGNRWSFNKITAEWWDMDEAKLKQESVTNSLAKNTKEYIVEKIYKSAREAKKAAEAKKQNLLARSNKLTLNVIGNPAIRPFTPILINSVRKHVNGLWRAGNVSHTLSASGYTTRLTDMSEMV